MASQQQSEGVEQVNTAVEQLNQLTQQNAANAEESASAAEELSSQSQEMKEMVNLFQLNRRRDQSDLRRPSLSDPRESEQYRSHTPLVPRTNGRSRTRAISDSAGLLEF